MLRVTSRKARVFLCLQPRSQCLSSYRPLSSLAPGDGKMRDTGNEVALFVVLGLKE